MKPQDMPEPADGARVVVVKRVGPHDEDTLYRRDDAHGEEVADYEEDRWFDPRGDHWPWSDVVRYAKAVYLVNDEPVAKRDS